MCTSLILLILIHNFFNRMLTSGKEEMSFNFHSAAYNCLWPFFHVTIPDITMIFIVSRYHPRSGFKNGIYSKNKSCMNYLLVLSYLLFYLITTNVGWSSLDWFLYSLLGPNPFFKDVPLFNVIIISWFCLMGISPDKRL